MNFIKVATVLMSVYVLLCIVLYFVQELLLFQSGKKLKQDYKFQFDFPYEEVYLKPSNEVSLHGVLLKSENPKGVILFFHGNRASITRWGKIVEYFLQFNYDILVMDYRGYGKSYGTRTENKLHRDAHTAFQYLLQLYDANNIVIYGRSLGTGIATKLASEVTAKCLILETPYKSLNDLMQRHLFMFPTQWLINYNFRSDLFINNVKSPIHIFHGTNDRVVPIESALRLVEVANRKNINFNKIDEGKHNNLNTFEVYKNEISQILNN